jgi:signal-transduction protein with cAMP-binding, CBS, and nucleotidyltransferase domain
MPDGGVMVVMGAVMDVGAEVPVRLVASQPPVRVQLNCSIGEVAQTMRRANISSAVVGTEATEAAIVTERDLARALAAGLGPKDAVAQVAVRHPMLVGPDTSVLDAATKMLHDRIRHLLVVENGTLVGILSMRDVMAVLLRSVSPEAWSRVLGEAPGRLSEVPGSRSEIWFG